MNRKRLQGISAACIIGTLSILSACEQENYETGDGKYSLLTTAFVEAPTNQERQVAYVETDDGERLTLNAPYTAKWLTKADTVYRAVLYYYQEGDAVRPYTLSALSTATVLPVDSFKKGVRTDPVKFESAWVSKTKKYLNAGIYLKMGTSDNADAHHLVGVVRDTIMLQADGRLTAHLRLYHYQGEVPEYYSQRTYFSIPLKDIAADSVRFSLNTYDGMVVKTFPIK